MFTFKIVSMAKLTPAEESGVLIGYYFDCPGCGAGHIVHVAPHQNNVGASWQFNGDLERPSFSPSILVRWDFTASSKPAKICHLFVKDGQLEFCADSTHKLAGQTVVMPEAD